MALTQSGKLYTWGLIDDGRLGVRKPYGGTLLTSKNEYTPEPQMLTFTDDHIEEISASGSVGYCKVTGVNDLLKQGIPEEQQKSSMVTRVFLWGHVGKGVNLSKQAHTHYVPTQFKEIQPYLFSSLSIQQDFAIGIGHSIKLTIKVPSTENSLDQSNP